MRWRTHNKYVSSIFISLLEMLQLGVYLLYRLMGLLPISYFSGREIFGFVSCVNWFIFFSWSPNAVVHFVCVFSICQSDPFPKNHSFDCIDFICDRYGGILRSSMCLKSFVHVLAKQNNKQIRVHPAFLLLVLEVVVEFLQRLLHFNWWSITIASACHAAETKCFLHFFRPQNLRLSVCCTSAIVPDWFNLVSQISAIRYARRHHMQRLQYFAGEVFLHVLLGLVEAVHMVFCEICLYTGRMK